MMIFFFLYLFLGPLSVRIVLTFPLPLIMHYTEFQKHQRFM